MPRLQAIFLPALGLTGITLGAVNGPCSINNTPGVCLPIAQCTGSGASSQSGFCPDDPADVKCCIQPSCGTGGSCRFVSQCSGTPQSGLCPGPAEFQCCQGSAGGANIGGSVGGSSGGSSGASSTSQELSTKGAEFITGFEKYEANFYYDAAGVKTIGYGHACQPESACNSIRAPLSQEAAIALFKTDAARFVSCVNSNVKVSLTQNQFDALVSFAFNLGCGELQDIAVYLNRNDFSGATTQMKRYIYAKGRVLPGLVRRRQEEVNIFNS